MHRTIFLPAIACAIALGAAPAQADRGHDRFSAKFSGFEEVGALGAGQTGAILSAGTATLDLDLDRNSQVLTYTLDFSGLGSNVTQSHIHFGKRHVGGGIMVFFCSNLANPPAGTPACPANGGTVSGTITPASVIGPTAQGVTPGNFDALVEALDSETAYGNIHTTNFPAGEIRGQIRHGRGHGHD
ncbi:MAG TPA: CHRD domain-containing protein [Burkholderiales bacterium]|nr:CHRD domain-containing protein [Burkholderiales bacterium]